MKNAAKSRWTPRSTLAVVSAGTLLVLVVFTIPIATLTSAAGALGAGPGAQAWILSAMSVGTAAGLLASGAIGDDHGRRRVFLAGMLLLSISSALGALAPGALLLIIARVLQGLGASGIIACGLGLIGHVFPAGPARARATGIWAAALGAGVTTGPILSAGLDTIGGFRLPYAVAALVALVIAVVGRARLPESRVQKPRGIDVAGALLLGLGLASMLAGLTEGRSGWDRPLVIALLSGGVGLVALFAVVEARIDAPMLDLDLFRRPTFSGAAVAALAAGAGVLSLLSLVPTLLERAMSFTTLAAATVLLAWSATSIVSAYAVRWIPRLTPGSLLIVGLVGCGLGQLALGGIGVHSSIARLLPGLFLAGIANGVLNAALGHEAVSSVPPERAAMGGGATYTARYLGSAVGLTVVTVLLTSAGAGSGARALVSGWNVAVFVTAAFSLLGALIVFVTRRQPEADACLVPCTRVP